MKKTTVGSLLLVLIAAVISPAATVENGSHWKPQDRATALGDPQQPADSLPKLRYSPALVKTVIPRLDFASARESDLVLNGRWRMIAVSQEQTQADRLSRVGFDDSHWLDSKVPGTVLGSLVDAGVLPNPNYGFNNLAIPESLNRQDYWFRVEFSAEEARGDTAILTFQGINYGAEVWINGHRLGTVRGAFTRGTFDVSTLLEPKNALVVRIQPPPHPGIPHEQSMQAGPGPNGGALCLDGPTFFCTEGWDWIPGIRDRCIGIWQPVVLHRSGRAVIGDLRIRTTVSVPDLSTASVWLDVPVTNTSEHTLNVRVSCRFGEVSVEKTVDLKESESRIVRFDPKEFPTLMVKNPELWWPNGYGAQPLYRLETKTSISGGLVADRKVTKFGIREITYELEAIDHAGASARYLYSPLMAGGERLFDKSLSGLTKTDDGWMPTLVQPQTPGLQKLGGHELGGSLVILVNGVRILCKGGNWGIDDAMKRYDLDRLETAIRLEHDAHFTMIRNWCGQTTQEAFYDLCDKYGILVWNDFWESTQNFNLQPTDIDLFLDNARDTIDRFRNHPSIAIWCGRNEGVPPAALNDGLDFLVLTEDGSRFYQPSSTEINMLHSGPWSYRNPALYFTEIGRGFTTEVGLPAVPSAETMRSMLPEADQWPIGDGWAYHDWHQSAGVSVKPFMAALSEQLGAPMDLSDFCRKAQIMNFVGYRAIFEGLGARMWDPNVGRLLWMSHPAWPSTVWQIYSSNFDTGGAYFGTEVGCEPTHVEYDPSRSIVVVSNSTRKVIDSGNVLAEVFDSTGSQIWRDSRSINVPANSSSNGLDLTAANLDHGGDGQSPGVYLRLRLVDRKEDVVSQNFYWLPKGTLAELFGRTHGSVVATIEHCFESDGERVVELRVKNPSSGIALAVSVAAVDAKGAQLFPAFASEGMFSLVGGEVRDIVVRYSKALQPSALKIEGWNCSFSIALGETKPGSVATN